MAKPNSVEMDWARAPPPSGPAWRRIATAIYNPEEKSFLGRTPKRWGIVLTFYMVFYAVLALLFAACMGGLFLTLTPDAPTYTLDKSLIGSNPGVASRPRPEVGFELRYNSANVSEYDQYIQQLMEFLKPYQETDILNISSQECSAAENYGFPNSPCFFIKVNKIIWWQPDCYDDVDNLPVDMPEDLKEYISNLESNKRRQIWISCWEERNNETTIEFLSRRGLSADYYPYLNTEGYLSPLVAIKITPPVNKLVSIRCRVWAKNIVYNKSMKEPSGYTRFQVFIEDKTSANDADAQD